MIPWTNYAGNKDNQVLGFYKDYLIIKHHHGRIYGINPFNAKDWLKRKGIDSTILPKLSTNPGAELLPARYEPTIESLIDQLESLTHFNMSKYLHQGMNKYQLLHAQSQIMDVCLDEIDDPREMEKICSQIAWLFKPILENTA